ncbi:hypothetical protein [Bradyrhizobium sp.]|uniref:hypothetical protein n=1 Tax=Bradyrhizobium sp. TaxID=376 RepID=UPI0029C0E9A1|nr:hypothetical protein [Bradyrhizobium sp.]
MLPRRLVERRLIFGCGLLVPGAVLLAGGLFLPLLGVPSALFLLEFSRSFAGSLLVDLGRPLRSFRAMSLEAAGAALVG